MGRYSRRVARASRAIGRELPRTLGQRTIAERPAPQGPRAGARIRTEMEPTTTPSAPVESPPRTPWGALLFCALLIAVGCVFLGLAIKRHYFPTVVELPPMQPYDLAEEAKKLVR